MAALNKFMLDRVLALPPPVLRFFSSGADAHKGGRTLDPRLQFLASAAKRGPAPKASTPEDARRLVDEAVASIKPPPEPGVRAAPYTVPGPAGQISCRLYRPDNQDPAMPVLVFAHCGGGVVGDLETCDAFCRILARIVRGPVLSVDYRLAPEHRFPAGLDDVMAVYRHARDNAAEFGGPALKAAIGGDSAGGNFAAVICQLLREAGEPQPALQLLIYPAVDLVSELPSMRIYADAYPMTLGAIAWFMEQYLPEGVDPADPRISPLRAADLSGLAPAVVVTAGFDPVVDQGEAYARGLRKSGVPTAYRCYDSLIHCFTAYTGVAPAADVACREIAGLVREGLQGRIPVR